MFTKTHKKHWPKNFIIKDTSFITLKEKEQ